MKVSDVFLVGLLGVTTLAGCQSTPYNGHGIVFGCDGSGAGVVIRWGPSARKGLRDGGYEGVFSPHRWQTGLGAAADHMSSAEYKRSSARLLAKKIVGHHRQHPDDPIFIGGLSAGCAVAIYALEELPPTVGVEQVVLLSSSVSADYDLSRALTRVRGQLYAFTSSRDAVLSELVSAVGTADRRMSGDRVSGLRGFHPPRSVSTDVTIQYHEKVRNVSWTPEFSRYGHHGGHTDVVASPFIARYVAPLLTRAE